MAGVPADLHVSWQASGGRDVPTADLSFRARAVSTDGGLLWEQAADPIVPLPANWPAGQVYRLTHRLLPRAAAPGATPANLEVCAVQGEVVESCAVVGRVSVINRAPVTTLPVPPQVTSGANWGEQLILDGYDVQQSGDTIALTLYWLVPPISPPPVALKRFVHASDATGQILAQVDSTPDNGGIPMPWWRPGEYVVDTVRLSVPAGRQVAQLLVGWYDAATGKRTPVRSATGELLVDDRLAIAIR